jgi:hypothetical protein
MPLVILHHLLNVFVQLANKRGFTKKIPRYKSSFPIIDFWVYSTCDRNENQESSWSKRAACKADKLTAICELSRQHGHPNFLQYYGPPRPFNRDSLAFFIYYDMFLFLRYLEVTF